MYLRMSGVFIIFLSLVVSGYSYLEHDSWATIELYHALGSDTDQFSFRGNVTIPSLNSGLSNVEQVMLTASELDKLKALAKHNDFYRMKATVVYPNGSTQRFLTSSKACYLLQSQLNDLLWLALDASGYVTAVTHTSSTNSVECSAGDILSVVDNEFSTDVLIRHAELAPVPDTASFIQKIEREREARERGEVRDNRGFFAKYWMYIVPVVLLVFISGATNQDAPK